MTGNRADALARLDVFVGEWVMEARFPGDQPTPSTADGDGPQVRSRFEWALGRQFLLQGTEIPIPEAPDDLTIVSVDPQTGAVTQHYCDSRGVARLYAMTLAGGDVDAHAGVAGLHAPGFPAAFHRHLKRGREHHQRCLGEVPQRFRLGARLRSHLLQGRLT